MNNPDYNRNNQPQSSVSKGEMFVGLNLLSKIGVIFIIIGVIAFSAASAGYLHDFVRMALVIAVGAIMLVSGEIFYRKKSVIFANALIYGGVAELFISVLIGRHGLEVFSSEAVHIVGLAAAAIGFLLSARYKSQPLAIVTIFASSLVLFSSAFSFDNSAASAFICAGCIMMIHATSAVIAFRNSYTVLNISGCCLVCLEALVFYPMCLVTLHEDANTTTLLAIIFVLCSGFLYISGALLNAAESDGLMSASEITVLILSQSFLIFYTDISLFFAIGKNAALIAMIVIAVIYLICTIGYSLKFSTKCTVSNIFINLLIATSSFSIITLVSGSANYYAIHGLAAAILIVGVIIERNMLKIWGYVLLGIAEIDFLFQLFMVNFRFNHENRSSEKIPLHIVNLLLWFGIMAFFIIMKKSNSVVFKIYSCLAFLNAGILGSNLLLSDLGGALSRSGMSRGSSMMVTALLCSCLWMILGLVSGKLKYLEGAGMPTSLSFYAIGLMFLGFENILRFAANEREVMLDGLMIAITIIVNIISVLTVLDITTQIANKAPKFAKAVGLVVSSYGVITLTVLLGTNNFVKFTSYIISIIYIITAALWIFIGFKKQNKLLRYFGLSLSLLVSAKLFLFDFYEANDMIRTLLFIGFGVALLGICFGYGMAEKKLRQNNQK
ncbi:MAG: DUF2339 domain-containing protein [Oscillospiraceae bacterium]|nr:DUF2339 domain-containing protein [Oscillospiraceae bacterium]